MRQTKYYGGRELPPLPIDACITELVAALRGFSAAVLVAPPGAGKTSRVPLALLDEEWNAGRQILVLEPRRLAARAAAEHMASLLGEKAGGTIGYRVRMDNRTGPQTRIEFITEGVFTRMILDDPELAGVGCVLFDEFHERNLDADLGLALALDVQGSLRPDLRIVPMSATLDGSRVAQLLDEAPVIESEGRSYPVEMRYVPRQPDRSLEDEMARAIRQLLVSETGSVLCFLPGLAEIRRTSDRMGDLPANVRVYMLYGAMRPEDQRSAIAPPESGFRKIVLATSIAQTSLTLEGVRVVIDSGLARVPRHEPSTGLTRLETVRASKAAITQRAGRAGRMQPGVCLRLWHEGQSTALPDHDRPEILEAELSGLVLDLAEWGVQSPSALNWLDLPPPSAWEVALTMLKTLGAVDDVGRITSEGKALRKMPLPPRLAHMVLRSAGNNQALEAAKLALVITERGLGGDDPDLSVRLDRLSKKSDQRSTRALKAAASMIRALPSHDRSGSDSTVHDLLSPGAMLSFAWPERIARRVGPGKGDNVQYLLANGRRALLDGISALGHQEWLAICEVQGRASSGRILSAARLTRDEIETFHAGSIINRREVTLDASGARYRALEVTRLGQISLSRKGIALSREDNIPDLLIANLLHEGLGILDANENAANLKNRMALLHMYFPDRFKPVDDQSLTEQLENWLLPVLNNATGPADLTDEKLCEGLELYLGYENAGELERLAPRKLKLPSGQSHRLDYGPDGVSLSARVQEFFGLTQHPAICEGRVPVALELLSPARRPIQKTLDIAGFWDGSWQDVRKEMRGRYPKHFWPEEPASEQATTRTKPKP